MVWAGHRVRRERTAAVTGSPLANMSSLVSAKNRLLSLVWPLLAMVVSVAGEVATGTPGSHGDLLASNHHLLSELGLARLQGSLPKRVPATEDDSRVFVVRLPPSQHYYSLLKAPPAMANSVSKQVGVGFRSNGKPARVYHWNIPVLKKMAVARRRSAAGGNKINSASAAKPSKQVSKGKRKSQYSLHRLKQEPPTGPSPYYYAPAKKSFMHKLLGGNGKPHAMYVLEKSKAPAYYQRLLP